MDNLPLIVQCGDRCVSVEFENLISPEVNKKVRSLLDVLDKKQFPWVTDMVPSYRSLLVCYDPNLISKANVDKHLLESWKVTPKIIDGSSRLIEIPTMYGGIRGPDLEFVANYHGVDAETIIATHSEPVYQVYMLGFSPGFPYLGGMPEKIATPRLESPRKQVPAGSVGIANQQTGIYPSISPGGWRLIGQTPLILFDQDREPPAIFAAGDKLKFFSIDEHEFTRISKLVSSGKYYGFTESTKS